MFIENSREKQFINNDADGSTINCKNANPMMRPMPENVLLTVFKLKVQFSRMNLKLSFCFDSIC